MVPQKARESLVRDGSHHPPLRRTPHVVEEPPETPIPAVVVTQSEHSVNNIWADHRVRRAMFPTRQRTMQPDDEDEDIYQMFVPTEPSGPEPEVPPERSEATSSPKTARPCSWHVEQVPAVQVDPPANGGRVLRRASSAGEKATEARQSPDSNLPGDGNLEVIHTESSSNDISGSSSAEQLTLDDIENVYDNISYEDLKSMGLIRRDPEESPALKETPAVATLDHAAKVQRASEVPAIIEPLIEPDSSSESNRSSTQEGRQTESCDLQIVEENIYDTICFREPPSTEGKRVSDDDRLKQERESLLASEQDLAESLKGFLSEESLHFVEDNGLDSSHPALCTPEPDYSSSSASETFCHRSEKGDKMSEQVDEIWNDLENYIKTNEKKADRLPAAFPVSVNESPEKKSSRKNSPTKSTLVAKGPQEHRPIPPPAASILSYAIPVINLPESQESQETSAEENHSATPASRPLPVTPEPVPGTVKNIRKRLARLSSGSFRLEDDDLVEVSPRSALQRDSALKEFNTLFPGEFTSLDSPLASSSSLFLGESVDFPLDLMDKSKSRVFLMARQYSQKIKKANQLLRMRSMDPGDCGGRTRAEKKQKDLAAILEEKKQGGAAIGNSSNSHKYQA